MLAYFSLMDTRNSARPSTSPRSEHVIAIIGSGFSGTMLAAHLLRELSHSDARIRVVLIEREKRLGRGAAYCTTCTAHLLNVPAKRMSAFPDSPDHYLLWLNTRDEKYSEDSFTPRALYGEYIEHVLQEAIQSSQVPLDIIHEEIVDITPLPQFGTYKLITQNGRVVHAQQVALTTGHPAPRLPVSIPDVLFESGQVVLNPWNGMALKNLGDQAPLLLLGSGLTAIDVILEARVNGYAGKIQVLSRHGLLPLMHQAPKAGIKNISLRKNSPKILAWFQQFRAAVGEMPEEWRAMIDSLRPHTQELWGLLAVKEKLRFLRHLRPYWDLHRHRVAPEVGKRIIDEIARGQVQILAGRIESLQEQDGLLTVHVQPRGTSEKLSLQVQKLVNCTGPATGLEMCESRLTKALLSHDLVKDDALGIGLEVDNQFRVLNKKGKSNSSLYAFGPLLKGQLWESTAVPELRVQAQQVAQHIATEITAKVAFERVAAR